MREKVAKFINNYAVEIILYIAIFLIALTNSIIGVVIYTAIIHLVLAFLVAGLYNKEIIRAIEEAKASRKSTIHRKLRLGIVYSTFMAVLIIKGWLYLTIITAITMMLHYVHSADAGRKVK